MISVHERCGNFTSSEIVALNATGKQQNGFGVGAITYIMLTNMERMLGRSVDTEVTSKEISWGNLMEPYVFEEKLGTSYTYSSKVTDVHPTIPYWVGSKDGTNEAGEKAVTDLKNPMTLKSFMQLVLPLYCGLEGMAAMNAIRNGFTHNGFNYPPHSKGETYYQQLVSNSEINKTKFAELIVHMPSQSELPAIKKLAEGNPSLYWLNFATDDELPFLPIGCPIKCLNIIRFEVPQADKDLLTANVQKAGKLLIPRDGEKVDQIILPASIPTIITDNSKPILA